ARHAGPLGALAGKDEGHLAPCPGPRGAGDEVGVGGAGGEGAQRGEQRVAVGGGQDGPVLEVGAVVRGCGRHRGGRGAGPGGPRGAAGVRADSGSGRGRAAGSADAASGGVPGRDGAAGSPGVPWAAGPAGSCPGPAGSGASSRITWALVPLIPKALTPARRTRCGSRGQGSAAATTRSPPSAQSTCSVGVPACREAGRVSCRSARTVLMTPAMPAAAWVWPRLDFREPMASGRPAGRSGPNTRARARP